MNHCRISQQRAGLIPKRRAATPDSETTAAPNTRIAAGQPMAQLAYDFYGLAEEAIKLGGLPPNLANDVTLASQPDPQDSRAARIPPSRGLKTCEGCHSLRP